MFFEIRDPNYERLPFLVTTVGSQEVQPPVYRPNGGFFHHFLYVTEGEGLFTLPDQQLVLRKNQGIFMRQRMPVSYEAVEGTFSTAWLTFRGSGADALLDYYALGDYLLFPVSDQMIEALDAFEQNLRRKTITARSADGYAFVLSLFERITLPSSDWNRLVVKVNRYLESHFHEPISLDEVAQSVGVDRFSLCQQYKKLTGLTVMTRLRNVRIQQAKSMLCEQYSVQEISRLCGFESPSYFGQIFRSITGMTPGEYRAAYASGAPRPE